MGRERLARMSWSLMIFDVMHGEVWVCGAAGVVMGFFVVGWVA